MPDSPSQAREMDETASSLTEANHIVRALKASDQIVQILSWIASGYRPRTEASRPMECRYNKLSQNRWLIELGWHIARLTGAPCVRILDDWTHRPLSQTTLCPGGGGETVVSVNIAESKSVHLGRVLAFS